MYQNNNEEISNKLNNNLLYNTDLLLFDSHKISQIMNKYELQ
jgi:hypothetical protein